MKQILQRGNSRRKGWLAALGPRRLAVGIGALALGAMAAMYPYTPDSTPAPMDALVEHVDEAPSFGINAAVRRVVDGGSYIDALSPGVSWDLPNVRNERVDFWIEFLSGRNADKTRLWLERQGRYAPLIRQALAAEGMPQDLLYLAMIESGLSTKAYSHAAASGMWQFIAETGRRYDLRIDGYVDERRDPVKSTVAALKYLSEMHEDFGSWFLAAAGYNSGENRVARLLRERAGGATGDENLYWVISPHLPRETRDYVPLTLAMAHIAKQPERYGFTDLAYQEPLEYEQVQVPGGVSLAMVARAAGVDEDVVEELNPHLMRGITPPGETWPVRVPLDRGADFAANFERILAETPDPVEYVIRRGETLTHIARRFGVSVDALQSANGGVNPRRIQAGQRIRVPVDGAVVALAEQPRPEPRMQVHQVRRGDTLWDIARRYDVSVSQLRSWNSLSSRSAIQPGQRLRVRT
ncbi:MAG TPA: LysM peptidoglycan-binding domain-containing protein [Longimicrobiales bacterium]|nr:LysM peptidoglycan-binding domain-containing protein [Longimicrobiales bacterium]